MNPLPILVALSLLTAVPAQRQPGEQAPAGIGLAELRRMAVRLERDPAAHLPAVARTAWTGPSLRVRSAAARLLVRLELEGAAVEHVALGLRHPDPAIRAQAAEALRRLGYPQAARLAGLPPRDGGVDGAAPRQHVAVLEMQAYLRDFDPEVA